MDFSGLPPEQQAIRDKCFHPTGTFYEFKKEEIEQSIPDRFERMVAEFPIQSAVKTRENELTYEELNTRANHIAHSILGLGEIQEESVALLVELRSTIAAILGIWKAGKCYVPMDPSLPELRIAQLLEDAGAKIILTDSKNRPLADKFAAPTRSIINVDEQISPFSCGNPGLVLSPDHLATIFYTSGSTGQPKGVIQNHRNLLHNTMVHSNAFHFCSEDRMVLLTSSGVGALTRFILPALLNGSTAFPIDIRDEGMIQLQDWINQERATTFRSVATIYRQFVNSITGKENFPTLRLVQVGSEPAYASDVELYKKHFSDGCIFAASFGATEITPVRYYFADKDTEINFTKLPAGYGVEDTEVLLLDESGQEVGPDQVGEICVKSPYLTPGYWRRPDLNRAAFLPDSTGGNSVYRMGDMGLRQFDDCLIHLGRKDFQVKVGGNRIELAEVEAVLLEADGVREAVVVSREDRPGLVAYVVWLGDHQPAISESDLRSFLQSRLPGYMVPSAFSFLKDLPLLPTGKVDRRALPDPEKSHPQLETAFVAPRTETEENLAQIWAEVLDLNRIGIHDRFLDLGGNSLLASQVISRVIKTFGVDLPLRILFETATVAEMALAIVQGHATEADQARVERMLHELEGIDGG